MKFKYKKWPRSSDSSEPYVGMPFVPISVSRGPEYTLPFLALLDSGADEILMHSDFATQLGIPDVKTGRRRPTLGVGDQMVDVYFHDNLEIQIVGDTRKLTCSIGFVENPNPKRIIPLLGRSFFKHFKAVVFEENNQRVELKA